MRFDTGERKKERMDEKERQANIQKREGERKR